MNDMTVGMENLPNVFIDKITISNVTDEAFFRIQVILKMFDYAEDHSWYNKIAGLKVKCGLIQDDEIIAGLNDGTLSLYDVNADYEKPDKIGIKSCDSFYSPGPTDGYKAFRTTFEFKLTTFPTNLNAYAVCFMDDLEFGIPQFDKFYGPMAAEKIYVGGVPNEESGYFYNPQTNEEYGGPVHQHSSGYMEGSEHIDTAHAGLRYVSEDNYKMIVGSNMSAEVFAGIDTGMIFDFGDGTPSLDNLGANTGLTSDDVDYSTSGTQLSPTDSIDYYE
jgi:hypothetical protein